MKDIFSDLYDRVLSFFTTQTHDDTKVIAKSRLRTVLMQDRVGFSERAMQMLKDDMIDSISKYLEIDVDSFDLSIDANENATILNLSIPVLRPKTDEEIDEALSLQEKVKIEKTQEIVGELKELVKEKAQELAEQLNEEEQEESVDDEETATEKEIEEEKDQEEDEAEEEKES
ncbi:MAG: cell division topological specificity factor MinE [Candidatus Gastranaerophilales bacterium]|nr:cell division topological specificity factor MinE [Candidatus Gastranaerophilales bacterium]